MSDKEVEIEINAKDIVIDFDGTCVTHAFPLVGLEIGAPDVLRELVSNGHRLILFTMRSDVDEPKSEDPNIHPHGGEYLTHAVEWFKTHDIPLYGVQTNPTQKSWTHSPKAYGQIYIDDAALGAPLKFDKEKSLRPFIDWVRARELLVLMGVIVEKRGFFTWVEKFGIRINQEWLRDHTFTICQEEHTLKEFQSILDGIEEYITKKGL